MAPVTAWARPTDELSAEVERAQERLARLRSEAEQCEYELIDLNRALEETERRIATYDIQIPQTQAELEAARSELADAVAESYKMGSVSLADIVLSASSFDNLVSRITYANKVAEHEREAVDSVQAMADDLERQRAELRDSQQTQQELVAQSEQKLMAVHDAADAAEAYYDQLSAELKAQIAQEEAAAAAAAIEAARPMAAEIHRRAEAEMGQQQLQQAEQAGQVSEEAARQQVVLRSPEEQAQEWQQRASFDAEHVGADEAGQIGEGAYDAPQGQLGQTGEGAFDGPQDQLDQTGEGQGPEAPTFDEVVSDRPALDEVAPDSTVGEGAASEHVADETDRGAAGDADAGQGEGIVDDTWQDGTWRSTDDQQGDDQQQGGDDQQKDDDQQKSDASGTDEEATSDSGVTAESAAQLVENAYSIIGSSYSWSGYDWTGATESSYFTCSGVVDYALGLPSSSNSPETLYEQVTNLVTDTSQLKYGDLVFYPFAGRYPGHVGIYIGNGKIIDSIPNGGVQIRDVDYMECMGGGSIV